MKTLFLCVFILATPLFAQATGEGANPGGELRLKIVQPTNWIELSKNLEKAVPRLEMQDKEGNGACSAVIFEIDKDRNALALTAAHCVTHAPTDKFDFTVDDRHADVELLNNIFDLAIVSFRADKNAYAIPLASESPEAGSEVLIAGYAFGDAEIAVQFGHVAQSRNRETKDIRLDARIIFGDSGGAILDNEGHLVGITTAVYSNGPVDMGGAVRIETIQNFIDAYKSHVKKERKKNGR